MARTGRHLALAIGILFSSCRPEGAGEVSGHASGSAGGSSGIRIIALDSVPLTEDDSLYVAALADFALDPFDGAYYVADGFAGRAYRFARTGEVERVYGRPGGGPGEIGDTRLVFPVGDSLVAVDDFRDLAFELFDKETGEFVGQRSRDGAMGRTVLWSAAGDTLWLGFPDFPGGDFSALMWVPRTNQLRHLWRVPRIFRDHPSHFSMAGLGTTLARRQPSRGEPTTILAF